MLSNEYPIGISEKEVEPDNPVDLYHVTGWELPANLEVGDCFVLNPGTQNSQGEGVYFSEEMPRFTAAEGSKGKPTAIIHINGGQRGEGWFVSKSAFAKKYLKPKTHHTNGHKIELTIERREDNYQAGTPMLHCAYKLI